MITVSGRPLEFCDGVPRRTFLKAGFLGLGGLTLPSILRARESGGASRNAAVIFLELAGGPTQFETYDPKPDAPSEIRGPLGVVRTNVPGVIFSELMAEQAKVMDKLAIIRSIHHDSSSHDTSSHLTQTGYYKKGRKGSDNSMPSIGSITARTRGANTPGMPAYVAIPSVMRNGEAAHLGQACLPFETGGDPNAKGFAVRNLSPSDGLTVERLSDRRSLLSSLDARRRWADSERAAEAIDEHVSRAFDLVTGDRARKAFDIEREGDKTRDRYGRNSVGQSMLLARRLVEAGVTFVTVRVTGWDDHAKIADKMRGKGPAYDRGTAALVSDLHERGLDRDVMVVAMGEFGRTPKINGNAGRDHWGRVMSVLMAGGGLKVGQVVGASNRKGEVPAEKPYRPEHVLATVYRHLAIDPSTTFTDLTGRPRYVLERGDVIKELI